MYHPAPNTQNYNNKNNNNREPTKESLRFSPPQGNRRVSSTHPSEFLIETTAPSVGLSMRSELWLPGSGACPNKLARLRLILFVCMNNIWNQTVKMCCSRCSSRPTASFLSLLPAVVVRLSPSLFLPLSFALSLGEGGALSRLSEGEAGLYVARHGAAAEWSRDRASNHPLGYSDTTSPLEGDDFHHWLPSETQNVQFTTTVSCLQ